MATTFGSKHNPITPIFSTASKKASKQISKEEEVVVVGNYKYAVIYMGNGEGWRGRVFKL
jgi:hypothetical protein